MEFKRLSDVEVVAEPIDSANVLIEENGVIKKAPKNAVGGTGNLVVVSIPYIQEMDVDASDIIEGATCNKTYDEVVEMYCANEIDYVVLKMINAEEGYMFSTCRAMFLCNEDGMVSLSDAELAECIGFNFSDPYGNYTNIYYYKNGLSYVNPMPGPL